MQCKGSGTKSEIPGMKVCARQAAPGYACWQCHEMPRDVMPPCRIAWSQRRQTAAVTLWSANSAARYYVLHCFCSRDTRKSRLHIVLCLACRLCLNLAVANIVHASCARRSYALAQHMQIVGDYKCLNNNCPNTWGGSSVVERALRMREVQGSIPCRSIFAETAPYPALSPLPDALLPAGDRRTPCGTELAGMQS